MQNEELLQAKMETNARLERYAALYDTSLISHIIFDREGTIRDINHTGAGLLGQVRSNLSGCCFDTLISIAYRPVFKAFLTEVFASHASEACEIEIIRADKRPLLARIEAVADEARPVCHAIMTDITDRREIEHALLESKAKYQQLFDKMLNGLAYCRMIYEDDQPVDFVYLDVNDAFGQLTGLRNVIGRKVSEVIPGLMESNPELFDTYARVASGGDPEKLETYVEQLDIWLVVSVYSPGKECFVAVFDNITERKKAEENLRLLAKVFECGSEAFLITDADNNILTVNNAFTHITGYTKEDVVGKNPKIMASGTNSMEFYANLWRSIFATGHWHGEIVDRRKSGEIYPKWMSINTINDGQGNTTHYIGSFLDISERKNVEERMHHLAHYDVLTDLPNRTLFNDRLQQALVTAKRDKAYMALMFIDLDEFKPVNDTLGHNVGDLLLKAAAKRIQGCLRESDTAARIGGDEFIVLLPVIEERNDAMIVAEKICNTLNQPFELAGHCLHVSASIGVALYPEHGHNELQLYGNADAAMYHAKKNGRNNVQHYLPGMHVCQETDGRPDSSPGSWQPVL